MGDQAFFPPCTSTEPVNIWQTEILKNMVRTTGKKMHNEIFFSLNISIHRSLVDQIFHLIFHQLLEV